MQFSSKFFWFCLAGQTLAWAQAPVGIVASSDARLSGTATMVPGGLQVMSGTGIEAHTKAAEMRLSRGGQVRVCPDTKVTVSSSGDGQELQFSMGEGSIDANYLLGAHGDTVLTPDLRIVVSGPGQVDLSIGTDVAGNSCIDNRGVNAPYVLASQLIGDGVYRVPPNAKILVEGGRLDKVQESTLPCGCPQMPVPTDAGLSPQTPATDGTSQAADNRGSTVETAIASSSLPSAAPVTPKPPGQVRIQVDAPLVFDARNAGSTGSTGSGAVEVGPPIPVMLTAHAKLSDIRLEDLPPVQPLPPPQPKTATNSTSSRGGALGVLHAIRRFFGRLFVG